MEKYINYFNSLLNAKKSFVSFENHFNHVRIMHVRHLNEESKVAVFQCISFSLGEQTTPNICTM